MKVLSRHQSVVSLMPSAMSFALCLSAEAQQPRRVARIGYLDNGTADDNAELLDAFRKQMTQLDWIEGKNLTIESRYADRNLDRLSELALELVRLQRLGLIAKRKLSVVSVGV